MMPSEGLCSRGITTMPSPVDPSHEYVFYKGGGFAGALSVPEVTWPVVAPFAVDCNLPDEPGRDAFAAAAAYVPNSGVWEYKLPTPSSESVGRHAAETRRDHRRKC